MSGRDGPERATVEARERGQWSGGSVMAWASILNGRGGQVVLGLMVLLSAAPAEAQNQSAYLSCRVLSQMSTDFTQFAGSMAIWPDEGFTSVRSLDAGEQLFKCSREIRSNICRTFAGEIIDGSKMKEGALTGAFLYGMSGGGAAGGALLGAGASSAVGMIGYTIKLGQCNKQIDSLTAVAKKVSLDWAATLRGPENFSYGAFLQILTAAHSEGIISTVEINQVLQFTDRVRTLIGR